MRPGTGPVGPRRAYGKWSGTGSSAVRGSVGRPQIKGGLSIGKTGPSGTATSGWCQAVRKPGATHRRQTTGSSITSNPPQQAAEWW